MWGPGVKRNGAHLRDVEEPGRQGWVRGRGPGGGRGWPSWISCGGLGTTCWPCRHGHPAWLPLGGIQCCRKREVRWSCSVQMSLHDCDPQRLSEEPSEGSDLFGCAFSRYSSGLWVRIDCNRRRRNGETRLDVFMIKQGFPGGASGKEPACHCRTYKRHRFDPWVGKMPWRRAWQLTPVFLPEESYGQRRLAGYSSWGRKKLNMTEVT